MERATKAGIRLFPLFASHTLPILQLLEEDGGYVHFDELIKRGAGNPSETSSSLKGLGIEGFVEKKPGEAKYKIKEKGRNFLKGSLGLYDLLQKDKK